MFVSDLKDCVECLSYEEYEQQIQSVICSGLDNEIQLYMRESEDRWSTDYPCTLSILIKGRQAVVNYFSEGNEEMSASIGDLDREDDVRWQIGENDYSVAGYQILSLEKAMQCALQFFWRQGKPTCIAWEAL